MSAVTQDVTNFERAIYKMMRDPEFVTIGMYLMEMEIIADDKVGTAATDCVRRVWYSPKYFEGMSVDECIAALVHEVYHKFLNFIPRFERWAKNHPSHDRKHLMQTFNVAQDYFVNHIVKHQWNLPIQHDWFYDVKYDPRTHTTESIANELLSNPQPQQPQPPTPPPPGGDEQGEGGGAGGGAGDDSPSDDDQPDDDQSDDDSSGDSQSDDDSSGDSQPDDGDDARTEPDDAGAGKGDDIVLPEEYDGDINNVPSDEQLQNIDINNRAAAANADRMAKPARGVSGGGGDPFTGEIADQNYRATHNWEAQLNRYADSTNRVGSHTYSKPNARRRTAQGMLYPSAVGKELGTCVFAIDSSGSTSGGMVDYFLNEMQRALEQALFDKAVVIWCSDGIPLNGGVQEYTKHNVDTLDKRIRRTGYGTEFTPVFELVAEKYRDAACLTYLTDGGTDDYDINACRDIWIKQLRRMPVIWALADFGWTCTDRFVVERNKQGFGVSCMLPAEVCGSY